MEFRITDWHGVSTTTISDAMQGKNTLTGKIKPLDGRSFIAGPACTVQIVRDDSMGIFKGLSTAKTGDVLVVAVNGHMSYAFLGEIVITMAQTMGLAGIVIDGAVRDSQAIIQSRFPVFCQGITPSIGTSSKLSQVQVDIQCGGVAVHSGDIVVGDGDGVVVVPKNEMQAVWQKAKEKEKIDRQRLAELAGNTTAVRTFLQDKLKSFK